MELACDRSGSRVIDALWAKAGMKQKELIAREVAKQENKLRGDRLVFVITQIIGSFL